MTFGGGGGGDVDAAAASSIFFFFFFGTLNGRSPNYSIARTEWLMRRSFYTRIYAKVLIMNSDSALVSRWHIGFWCDIMFVICRSLTLGVCGLGLLFLS